MSHKLNCLFDKINFNFLSWTPPIALTFLISCTILSVYDVYMQGFPISENDGGQLSPHPWGGHNLMGGHGGTTNFACTHLCMCASRTPYTPPMLANPLPSEFTSIVQEQDTFEDFLGHFFLYFLGAFFCLPAAGHLIYLDGGDIWGDRPRWGIPPILRSPDM